MMYQRKKGAGVAWDDNVDSVRGLEDIHLKDDTRADIRRRHLTKVLGAQRQERREGRTPDPELIAEVSSKASRECRNKALALGKEDSAVAGTKNRNKQPQTRIRSSSASPRGRTLVLGLKKALSLRSLMDQSQDS